MLSDREVARRIRHLLEEYLGYLIPPGEQPLAGRNQHRRPDHLITAGPYRFAVEAKAAGSIDQVASAARQLRALADDRPELIPLIVVPFMSAGGRAYAGEQQVSWLDLSGNAEITAPGLRIRIDGKPNQFVRAGRPRDLFAPRSLRVTRALLLDPFKARTQADLSKETGLNRGTVSRVVAALLDSQLVERVSRSPGEPASAIQAANPGLLLEAWRDAADFGTQQIHRYLVVARSGSSLTERAAAALTDAGVDPAATGLSAAWYYAPYADFRTTSFYVRELPSIERLREQLGAREEPRGANLWLVLPKDDGVRMGINVIAGIPCVSAVQAYVDLKGHPERASDAAAAIKDDYLRWAGEPPERGSVAATAHHD